jgi:hypothetical protein
LARRSRNNGLLIPGGKSLNHNDRWIISVRPKRHGVVRPVRNEKQIRRLVREYAGKAHEIELRLALAPLADAFRAWERGAFDSFEIEALIHRFHQGPAREIYARYVSPHAEPAVAGAIATGVLARESVPAELLDELASLIAYLEDARRRE